MMNAALRTLAGVRIELLVAFAMVAGVEFFSAVVHPFPTDFGGTQEEICRHVQRYPHGSMAVLWPSVILLPVVTFFTVPTTLKGHVGRA
jgi:hypothetical protein